MKKEELKKALDILKRAEACATSTSNCDCSCEDCFVNYSVDDYRKSVTVAITVIEDVLKSMDALEAKKRQ